MVFKLINKGNVIIVEVLELYIGMEIGIDGSEMKLWKVNGII